MIKIKAKPFLISLLICLVSIIVVDILLHVVVLRDLWVETENYWLPPSEMNKLVIFGWLSLFAVLLFNGLIYTQLATKGIKAGLLLGLLLGLAAASGVFGLLTIVPWPSSIVTGMAIQQFIDNLLFGLIFGSIYKH